MSETTTAPPLATLLEIIERWGPSPFIGDVAGADVMKYALRFHEMIKRLTAATYALGEAHGGTRLPPDGWRDNLRDTYLSFLRLFIEHANNLRDNALAKLDQPCDDPLCPDCRPHPVN